MKKKKNSRKIVKKMRWGSEFQHFLKRVVQWHKRVYMSNIAKQNRTAG